MKNHIDAEDYCNYSFDDLHNAAFGKKLTLKEKKLLQKSDQSEINLIVKKWAKKAGWKTRSKKGLDKKVYIAFSPEVIGD